MKCVSVEWPTDGLEHLFTPEKGYKTVVVKPEMRKLPPADIVVFSGGADVNPALYKEQPHPKTSFSLERDRFSTRLLLTYRHSKKIGICRGAQFLAVFHNLKLYQHIEGHRFNTHSVVDRCTEKEREVLGDHHQGIPIDDNACIAASTATIDKREVSIMEAFWFEETESLGVQFHPEWNHKETEEYFWNLVERYIK